MSEQPEALRLADMFEAGNCGYPSRAAAELRRLHEVNQELLEALKLALPDRRTVTAAGDPEDYINSGWNDCLDAIRSALADQPAKGCEFCSHTLYAGTKCKNCGHEQPAQRKPLTDEQIKVMWRCSKIYGTNEEKALALARAIEAAHQIGVKK